MMEPPEIAIEFAHVSYAVCGRALLSELDLAVRRGETLMLLGRSGSGKTTSLKLINGLLVPTAGEVRVNGRPSRDWDAFKLRRQIGYAIQEVGLFPHYTVRQNVALIPQLEGWPAAKIQARVDEVLQLVGLASSDFSSRYPSQLSGGQRQRVGLARALAADPPMLLLDEPFGALDPITRAELQNEFKRLQHSLGKTAVFVTHDVAEALLLGDRIALLEAGRLRGIYAPHEFASSDDSSITPYMEAVRNVQRALAP